MKNRVIYVSLLTLTACGNPGEISDTEYAKYKELGAPKILYSCTQMENPNEDPKAYRLCLAHLDQEQKKSCVKKFESERKPVTHTGFTAGLGVAVTYNKLLNDAKAECDGTFKIHDSKS